MRWWFKKKTYMHFVISYDCRKVRSRCQPMPPNALHCEHILAHVLDLGHPTSTQNTYMCEQNVDTSSCGCLIAVRYRCHGMT